MCCDLERKEVIGQNIGFKQWLTFSVKLILVIGRGFWHFIFGKLNFVRKGLSNILFTYIKQTKAGSIAFLGVYFSTTLSETSVKQIKLLASQQHLVDYISLMTFLLYCYQYPYTNIKMLYCMLQCPLVVTIINLLNQK